MTLIPDAVADQLRQALTLSPYVKKSISSKLNVMLLNVAISVV